MMIFLTFFQWPVHIFLTAMVVTNSRLFSEKKLRILFPYAYFSTNKYKDHKTLNEIHFLEEFVILEFDCILWALKCVLKIANFY